MRNTLTIVLICMAISMPAFAGEYKPPPQVLFEPVTNYQKAQAERLRQEQIRLENERLRQELERKQREYERREQERKRAEAARRSNSWMASEKKTINESSDADSTDIIEKLEKVRTLGELREKGYLTEAEYVSLKNEILYNGTVATKEKDGVQF